MKRFVSLIWTSMETLGMVIQSRLERKYMEVNNEGDGHIMLEFVNKARGLPEYYGGPKHSVDYANKSLQTKASRHVGLKLQDTNNFSRAKLEDILVRFNLEQLAADPNSNQQVANGRHALVVNAISTAGHNVHDTRSGNQMD